VTPPDTAVATLNETIIRPPRRWSWPGAAELWEYRDLIYFLTKRELQIRYKQSFFGVSWAVFQPLVVGLIFALIFGTFLNTPTAGLPAAVFFVASLVPWLFTAQAIQLGATSLVEDADLISKVYFPRIALPIAKALSLVFDLAIALVVVIVFGLIYGVDPSANIWLAPAFLALGVVTTFAVSALSAAVNVKYRDVQLIMPMLVQVLLFVSAVIYPVTVLDETWQRDVLAVNPLSTVLEGFRWAMFDTPAPGGTQVLISVGAAVLLLGFALSYFQRTERYFADLV
jgi:lipopolysaccharide transport system permease protein